MPFQLNSGQIGSPSGCTSGNKGLLFTSDAGRGWCSLRILTQPGTLLTTEQKNLANDKSSCWYVCMPWGHFLSIGWEETLFQMVIFE